MDIARCHFSWHGPSLPVRESSLRCCLFSADGDPIPKTIQCKKKKKAVIIHIFVLTLDYMTVCTWEESLEVNNTVRIITQLQFPFSSMGVFLRIWARWFYSLQQHNCFASFPLCLSAPFSSSAGSSLSQKKALKTCYKPPASTKQHAKLATNCVYFCNWMN